MYHNDKAELLGQLQTSLFAFSAPRSDKADVQEVMQILAGLLVETLLLFEEPEQGLVHTLQLIADRLDMTAGMTEDHFLQPANPSDLDCRR